MAFPSGYATLDTDIVDSTDTDNADAGKDHATVHNEVHEALNDIAAVLTTNGDILTFNGTNWTRITRANLAADSAFTAALVARSNGLWTKTIDESGASFANFTGIAGTWASSGGIISDTSTASAQEGAYHATKIKSMGLAVAQCEVRLPSSGQAAGDLFGGISLFTTTGVSSVPGHRMLLVRASGTFRVDVYYGTITSSVTNLGATTWALDTWYTLKIVAVGQYGAFYLDGTFLGGVQLGNGDKAQADRVQLSNFGAKVDYRNLKVWELATDLLPA